MISSDQATAQPEDLDVAQRYGVRCRTHDRSLLAL